MLYWNANFQIPRSGTQAAHVYVIAEIEDKLIIAKWYSDDQLKNHMLTKEYDYTSNTDPYQYLLSLEEYEPFVKI